ncbi:MAG: hypothetical protein Q7T41_00485 [Candidatus Saccharibacteria bacterium]|nr:hypothetical protein [Candidatus Saccharibacteria bacterium]
MKRIVVSLLLTFVFTIGLVQSSSIVGAVDVDDSICGADSSARADICTDFEATNPEDGSEGVNPLYGPEGIITRAANGLSLAAGIIAILVIIVAGVKMTLSTGDSGKIKSSRDSIIYASVGLMVAILAQVIVRFVLNRIGV